jgi:hypothetical protein
MIGQLGGCNSFAAKGTVIDGAVRITGDLGNLAVLGIDQNAAATMTHSAMAFDNPVKSVGLHFLFNIRIFKFSHVFSPVPPAKGIRFRVSGINRRPGNYCFV